MSVYRRGRSDAPSAGRSLSTEQESSVKQRSSILQLTVAPRTDGRRTWNKVREVDGATCIRRERVPGGMSSYSEALVPCPVSCHGLRMPPFTERAVGETQPEKYSSTTLRYDYAAPRLHRTIPS